MAKTIATITADKGHPSFVISDERLVRDFLNAEGPNQRVFATGYWSIIFQAAGRGLIDLEKERPHLERFKQLNSTKRDHVNELDSPTGKIAHPDKGYTEKEVADMYQNSDWLKQQTKLFEQQRTAQQTTDSKEPDKAQEKDETQDKDKDHEQEI